MVLISGVLSLFWAPSGRKSLKKLSDGVACILWGVGDVFFGGVSGMEISPLAPLSRDYMERNSVEMTERDSFAITGGYPVCRHSMVKVRPFRLAVPSLSSSLSPFSLFVIPGLTGNPAGQSGKLSTVQRIEKQYFC